MTVGTCVGLVRQQCAKPHIQTDTGDGLMIFFNDPVAMPDQKTLSSFEDLVEAEPVGQVSLKGFAKPIAVYSIAPKPDTMNKLT
jgi:class 3 adenylate cyclase